MTTTTELILVRRMCSPSAPQRKVVRLVRTVAIAAADSASMAFAAIAHVRANVWRARRRSRGKGATERAVQLHTIPIRRKNAGEALVPEMALASFLMA